jgi:predicted restriction endonuclease
VPWVLEAAHIFPYRGPQTNHVTNGLLLRADLHVLFDLGLLRIDADSLTVELDPILNGTSYAELSGRP